MDFRVGGLYASSPEDALGRGGDMDGVNAGRVSGGALMNDLARAVLRET